MLIIKEPIRLKCRKAIETVNNSFNHRIMDNYQLMTVDYKEGEFLHLVTSPPEVYLAGQEMSSLVNSTVIYNNKELKLEMINNLLNRMSMTEQISLSYQDKIYIDTMLRKLGIKNTASFISHVMQQKAVNQKLEQQIEEFWQLLTNENINENYREEIIMQMQNRREEKREEHINYLYESIMNRLNTGVIYRIMENFNHASNFELSTMNHHQMVLSEQKKVSHQIFLNQLENYFSEQEIPFVYLEQNSYENVENLEEKSIRGSDVDASLHYLARLIAEGDLDSIYRRLSVIAYEDIGLANPAMGPKVMAAIHASELVGLPEARIPLGTLVTEMALSPKSNSAHIALDAALADIENGSTGNLPNHIKTNSPLYKYPHDYPNSWVKQQYLPDNIKNKKYYQPRNNKYEVNLNKLHKEMKEGK